MNGEACNGGQYPPLHRKKIDTPGGIVSIAVNTAMEKDTNQSDNDLTDSNEDLYTEGRLREVVLSVHERNPVARKKCIEHYGSHCYICQFDFAARYGPLFDGLIHVHHRNPVHLKDEEYTIDPIRDLIPVCPNCHMALHSKEDGVYTPEEIIEFIHK